MAVRRFALRSRPTATMVGWRPAPVLQRFGSITLLALLVAACGSNAASGSPSASAGAGASASATATPSDIASTAGASASAALVTCKAADLTAAIQTWQGAAGSRYASVLVTKSAGGTCTVRGTPGVRLLDGKGVTLLDSAKIEGIGGPKVHPGDAELLLSPGDKVEIDVQWSNWCKSQPARPLTVALVLTDRGGLLKATKAPVSGDDDRPSCMESAQSSQLSVTHPWSGPIL